MSVSQNGLFARLNNIEHGIARRLLHLYVLVVEAARDWRQDLVQVFYHISVIQRDRNRRKAVQARAALARIVLLQLLRAWEIVRADHDLCEIFDALVYLVSLFFCKQLLDRGLKLLASKFTLLHGSAGMK